MDAKLIARLIISVIAIINMLAAQFGWNPIEADESGIYMTVSTIFALVMWIRGFWKNNNFTEAAKIGQAVVDKIKMDEKSYRLENVKIEYPKPESKNE